MILFRHWHFIYYFFYFRFDYLLFYAIDICWCRLLMRRLLRFFHIFFSYQLFSPCLIINTDFHCFFFFYAFWFSSLLSFAILLPSFSMPMPLSIIFANNAPFLLFSSFRHDAIFACIWYFFIYFLILIDIISFRHWLFLFFSFFRFLSSFSPLRLFSIFSFIIFFFAIFAFLRILFYCHFVFIFSDYVIIDISSFDFHFICLLFIFIYFFFHHV